MEELKDFKKKIYVYTVNLDMEKEYLKKLGIDGLVTDYP